VVGDPLGLRLSAEADKYAEIGALLGGETADVGVGGALVRAIDHGALVN
jgi:hypothetical protein